MHAAAAAAVCDCVVAQTLVVKMVVVLRMGMVTKDDG